MSNTVDNAVKQKIIADYIKTPQGRSKLAFYDTAFTPSAETIPL